MAIVVDEDVRGLDVAVDDQVLVRVIDRLQHLEEQAQSLEDAPAARVAELGDGLPVDVLQHDERLTDRGDAGVVEPRNVRMFEQAQHVAFAFEALDVVACAERPQRHLQGDGATRSAIAVLGQPDRGHASAAQQPDQSIRADSIAVARRDGVQSERGKFRAARHEGAGLVGRVLSEHLAQPRHERLLM